jgi:chitodextrinase
VATPSGTSYSDTGLAASTIYLYRVKALDAAGNSSSYSGSSSATTGSAGDGQAPTAPASASASAQSPTQIFLSWSASTDNVGVAGYKVERCLGAGCTSFGQIAAPLGTSLVDTGLTGSTTYGYRVRAYDAAGNHSSYSPITSVTTETEPDTQAPTAPSNLVPTPGTTTMSLSWAASTDNVGVTSYLIERCQGSGCTSFTQIGTSTTTSYLDTGLLAGVPYGYRVRAIDAAGNLSAYSGGGIGVMGECD